MKRLVFSVPKLEQAQSIATAANAIGIGPESIHAVVKDPEMLHGSGINEATELETTELEQDMDWGMVAGGSVGMLAGLTVVGAGPFGVLLGGTTILVGSLLGIGLGGWLGTIVGEGSPAEELEKYYEAIEQGQILMMMDVPLEQLPEAFRVIKQQCEETRVEAIHLTHDHQLAA